MKTISNQLDIKLGQFTQEEPDSVLRKIKIEKQQGLMKYHQKYGKPGNSMTYYSDTVMPYIPPKKNRQMNKGMHLSLSLRRVTSEKPRTTEV